MSETGGGESVTPRGEFITNALGITHFVDGEGTAENPYMPQGSTLLKDSLMDSYITAMYANDREAKVYFEHNGHVVGVDRNMQAYFVAREGETADSEFQKSVEEITKQLRESGHRPLTEQELTEWQNDLRKQVAQNEKRKKGPMGFVDKISEKFGL